MFGALLFLLGVSLAKTPQNFVAPKEKVLATHEISLAKRYPDAWVNTIFKDNMLLAITYASGNTISSSPDWEKIEKPATYTITLKPGASFAFHDNVLPNYVGKVTNTTHSHFNSTEGYKSDGYLVGDGVCHLASLMYWAAKDAGLDTLAPTRHDFAPVPQIPREYGTAIFTDGTNDTTGQEQNLYITNNQPLPIALDFVYDGDNLTLKIVE